MVERVDRTVGSVLRQAEQRLRSHVIKLALAVGIGLFAISLQCAGAVPGVLPAFAAPEAYSVVRGDTLMSIAARYGVSVDTLVRLNGLRSPDFLRVGQKLVLAQSSSQPAPQASDHKQHVVAPGETLMAIARSHSVTVDDLARLNGLADPDKLMPGQALRMPDASGSSPAPGDQDANVGQESSMQVPYRSQFDGTAYEEGNCGPAVLGMLMAYYEKNWSTDDLRRLVNQSTGYWGLDGGSDWKSLVYAAEKRGFQVSGPYSGPKQYRKWTIDDLRQEIRGGHPTMLLVRYRSLPGHERSSWWGDHYIVFLGLDADGNVIYHDPAFQGNTVGAYRTMSQQRLMQAWTTSEGVNFSAMSLILPGR